MVEAFLLRNALHDLLRPRRVAVAVLLIAGPALIGLLVRLATRGHFDGAATYAALASLLVFGFVLPILAVVFGTGVISQEMEQKTIVYLLTRPVPRWRILLAKFAAAWVVTSVTAILATLALAAVTHQPGAGSAQTRLYPEAVINDRKLCEALQLPETPVAEYVADRLSDRTRQWLNDWDPEKPVPQRLVQAVLNDLNRLIAHDAAFYTQERFSGIQLTEDVRQLIAEKPRGEALARRNRLLLEAAFPETFRPFRTTLSQVPRDALILPLGALAYGAVALLLATIIGRALVVGLFLAFGWETWVPILPGNFKLVSVMTYLRALAPHARPETASSDLMSLFAAINPESVPAALAWTVLACVSVGCLALAMMVFSVKEYVPRDDA